MKKLLLIAFCLICSAESWTQTSFYQGKTITVVAAASAGSAYDLYARLRDRSSLAKPVMSQPQEVVDRVKILMDQ